MLNTLLYDLTKVNMDLIDCQDNFADLENLFFGSNYYQLQNINLEHYFHKLNVVRFD